MNERVRIGIAEAIGTMILVVGGPGTAILATGHFSGAMSSVGICMVFYLVYAELFEIQKICLWCTSVHVLTFFMFIFVVTGWPDATANWVDEDEDELALA